MRENEGSAALARATKDAETIRVCASAEADKLRLEGEGKAAAITAIGTANASATQQQVAAYGGPEYRLSEQIATRLFDAIGEGHQPVVPQIVVGSSGNDSGAGGLVSGLLASLLPKAPALPVALPPPALPQPGNGALRQ